MSNKTSPSTQHRQKCQAIRQSYDVVSKFLTEDVLLAMQRAAEDDGKWSEVQKDPNGYLKSTGVTVPEGLTVHVLSEPSLQTRVAPHGLENLIHPVCPPGLVPTLVRETVTMCAKLYELEFCYYAQTDLDAPIPPPLQRVCESRGTVCAKLEHRYEDRWYCRLPSLKSAQPGRT